MFRLKKLFVTFLLSISVSVIYAGNISRSENVEAELIPEVTKIQPGVPFTIALRLKMDKGWHTYWLNGADSGLPTEITWSLPDGFTTDAMQWPYPEKIDTPPLVTYGYHGEIFLLTKINVPANLKAGKQITISAKADWLECEDVCIPGSVDLSIDLKVSKDKPIINEPWIETFAKARSLLPVKESGWEFRAVGDESTITLQGKAPDWFEGELGEVNFFPYEFGVIEYAAKQEQVYSDGVLTLHLKRPSNPEPMAIEGVLVAQNGWRGEGSEKAHYIKAEKGKLFLEVKNQKSEIGSILKYLLFAFLGGIILNLMPCVLPVLSLKILGFVRQANEEKTQAWKHGALFTFGVLASFWVLAGTLLVLRAGGEEIGWGFQLQEPTFLIVLSVFLFLFGLSMFGVFEIGTSLTTIEGKTGNKGGLLGSFMSGVTATVVATPCTAPFMGSALGFALTQPAWASMSIFTFLGLGMALPYVILASFPSLLKFIPKPGRWMESMKQFMGFLLVATVLWLLWVLGLQTGSDMVIVVLGALLIISIAGWIYGRWGNIAMSKKSRTIATVIALLLLVSSLYASIGSLDDVSQRPQLETTSSEGIGWQPYSDQSVQKLVDEGKPVFIDFTAAWCLSCQVNDKVTFSSKEVQQKINDLDIATFKADWTSRDEKITNALAQFGRNSVPLYVYFPGGNKEPMLLPELITPGIVLDYFSNNYKNNH